MFYGGLMLRIAFSLFAASAAYLLSSVVSPARDQIVDARAKAQMAQVTPAELALDRDGAAVIAVPAPGRYSIRARTPTGARIELVDMIAGPLDSSGAAGLRDGRIDALLDKGVYKLRIGAVKDGKGTAAFTAEPFGEVQAAKPALVAGAVQSGELADMQQRSYRLDVAADSPVNVEAVGRALQDLRVWQEDGALVDLAFERTTIEIKAGHPMNRLRLEGSLPAGVYFVTAYGGEKLVWSDGAAAQPFLLRLARPALLAAGVAEGVIGPFGAERYDAPASYDNFRLDLPKQAPARLDAKRGGARETAELGKTSRAPAATLRLAGDGAAPARLEVSGYEGQTYSLRAVHQSNRETFEAAGPHLVSIDVAGEGGDEVSATALLARIERDGKTRVIASEAPRIGAGKAWRGKFNVLGPVSLLFEATRDGPVAIDAKGVKLRATIEPALGSLAARADGKEPMRYDLAAGFYLLVLEPMNGAGGTIDVTLGPPGLAAPAPAAPPSRASISFGQQTLENNGSYLALTNTAPGLLTGIRVVALPAALDKAPLALHQVAGKEIALAVKTPRAGRIVAQDERSAEIPLSLSDEKIENDIRTVTVKIGPAEKERALGIVFLPEAPATENKEPDKAQKAPNARAAAVGKPAFFDLAQDQTANLRFDVGQGGLYRVETLGRMKTALHVGASVTPRLGEGEANGAGGNGLVTAFLRAGAYRAAVTAKESTGHLGLSVSPASLTRTAKLVDAGKARATLAPGKGAAVPFEITRAGDYSLALTGLKRDWRARLEDAEGWPITQPGAMKEVTLHLEPGAYRLLVLPEDVEARMVFSLAPVIAKPALEGHGPHPLPFDDAQTLQWREPQAKDAARAPDVWRFSLHGEADVTLSLGEGMIGDVIKGEGERVGKVMGDRPLKAKLGAGDYRVEARSLAHDDRLDYEISLTSSQLQPGAPRRADLPAKLTFSLANETVVDLSTYGKKETIGALKTAAGDILERLQPQENDWNVALSRRLPAGAYRLELEELGATRTPVPAETSEEATDSESGEETGASDDAIEVRLAMFDETDAGPLAWGEDKTLPAGGAQRVTLAPAPAGALVVVAARSAAEVAVSIERRESNGAWRVVGVERGLAPVVAWPVAEDKSEWRATLWSVGGGAEPVTVTAQAVARRTQGAGDVAFAPVGAAPQPCAARIETPNAALVELEAPEGVVAGSAPNRLLRHAQSGALAPQSGALWLIARDCKAKARVAAFEWLGQDVSLDIGESERAQLPPLGAPRGKMRLWLARSTFTQPAIDGGSGMGVAAGAAIARASDAAPQLWNATSAAAMRASLSAIDTATLAAVNAGSTLAGVIPPMSAQPLEMEKSNGPLAFDLPAGVVAFAGPRAVFGDGAAVSRILHSASGPVVVINMTDAPLPARVARIAEASLALDGKTALKRFFGTAGQLSLPYEAQAGDRLFVIGADASVVTKSGRVLRGTELALDGAGELILDYKPGLVAAWIERKGVAPWPQPAPRAATLPDRVAMEGAAMRFTIARDAPAMLTAKSGAPALVAFKQNGERRTYAFPAGVDFHHYVAAGEATLDVYSPHDGALSGALDLSAQPVIEAHEGVNDAIAVPPGASALFSFVTKRDGDIGVGVRAEPDRVAARLFEASGKTLGEGLGQVVKLAPGRYFLEARIPADSTATTIRAAIVGVSPPPAAPPEEVVADLLDKAGMKKSK
ncbi:MAG: hypothetical protein CTY15_10825 [Methylocystis sp.]|nr:MAG: hypothetical protein CTY15_10825 [Methylocystis sp.]